MTIQKLASSSIAPVDTLQDWGAVGLPLSEPACQLRGQKMVLPLNNQPEVGLWECSPGRFRRQVVSAETMHVVSGDAVFTPDGGTPVALHQGDVYFFPANTTGEWEIRSTLRKVYVLFKQN